MSKLDPDATGLRGFQIKLALGAAAPVRPDATTFDPIESIISDSCLQTTTIVESAMPVANTPERIDFAFPGSVTEVDSKNLGSPGSPSTIVTGIGSVILFVAFT